MSPGSVLPDWLDLTSAPLIESPPLPPVLAGTNPTPVTLARHAEKLLHELKYIKQPEKDRIRNQAGRELDRTLRTHKQGLTLAIQLDHIKGELGKLIENTINPVNRDKLKEASDSLELASRMIRGGPRAVLPAQSSKQPSPPPASRGEQAAGFWSITAPASPFRLTADAGARLGKNFRPVLTAGDTTEWRMGDPAVVKVSDGRLILEAGSAGNFLITRRRFPACAIKIVLAFPEKTDAYVALRSNRGSHGWRGAHLADRRRGRQCSGRARVVQFSGSGTGQGLRRATERRIVPRGIQP